MSTKVDCSFGRAVPAREYEVAFYIHRSNFSSKSKVWVQLSSKSKVLLSRSSFKSSHHRWGVQLRSTMWPGAPVTTLCIQPPRQGLLFDQFRGIFEPPRLDQLLNLSSSFDYFNTGQYNALYAGWRTPSSCLTMAENMAFFCLPQSYHRLKFHQFYNVHKISSGFSRISCGYFSLASFKASPGGCWHMGCSEVKLPVLPNWACLTIRPHWFTELNLTDQNSDYLGEPHWPKLISGRGVKDCTCRSVGLQALARMSLTERNKTGW